MSHRLLRKAKPRRALPRRAVGGDADTKAGNSATVGEARTAKGLATQGLAALAISAVGLAIGGSVAFDSAAQAADSSQNNTIGHATHDHSHTMTAEQLQGHTEDQPRATEGQLDPFARSAYGTSRTAVRDEIDVATALEASRPAEEQRQAEDALKRQQEEEAAKAADAAAAPMAKDSYSLGARWGAVGAWSRYHTGQDLTAPVGTPIYAVAPGVVGASNAGGWAGVNATIHHTDGVSLYAHMASMTVNPGQKVGAGDLIGYVGMTGRTFGPHLHFEYYPNGASTSDPYSTGDPSAWLLTKGVRL